MADEVQTIVIDNGSGMIKAGFAGEAAPRFVFPSIVGRPRNDVTPLGNKKHEIFIGDEARYKACISYLKYPITHGIVTNWDEMEKIWHQTFYEELRVDPAEHPVLITEVPRNPDANSEKMIQLMFETFNVPSFYSSIPGILSLYASGRTTGITCEIGEGVTQAVPVYEGKILKNLTVRNNFGGCNLLNWLQRIMEKRGYYFTSSEEKEMLRDIMEKKGYVAMDYDSEFQKARSSSECDSTYTLEDGNSICLSKERFTCPELLFQPHMYGYEYDSIDKVIYDTIDKCSKNIQKDFFTNIILSGGITTFEGFPERLEKEITKRAPPRTEIRVVAAPERKYYAWLGGSIFASLAIFPQSVVTHDEYNDAGPGIVHRKCEQC